MALHYRKRGAVWHVRGTIRVGREAIRVPEHSTGCRTRAEAQAVGAAEEARLRAERIEGDGGRRPTLTVADCISAYRARPAKPHPFDGARLDELLKAMGHTALADAPTAWSAWLARRGRGLAPSTAARWLSILRAALNHGAAEYGVDAPRIRPVGQDDGERVVYLTRDEEARLLAAYSKWAAPVMVILCHTGMRTSEALGLDWRRVDWSAGVVFVEHSTRPGGPRTKTGKSRRIGMRPVVRATLLALWEARGRPEAGRVFLNRRGVPYADTRFTGGNPLAKAHRTACRNAGVEGFRVHDWRHHFAVGFLKKGGNLRALCQIAGWSSMRMVQRYAVFEQSDLDHLMARTA